LRSRAFRWYWFAQWPALLGTWMQLVALGYLVYSQTRSTTAVGLVAAADGIPALVLSPVGGLLADRLPRRRVLLATHTLLACAAATLGTLVLTGHASLAAILVVACVLGAADAIDLPARQALIGDLVERDLIVSAVALGSVVLSTTRIVGPSLAGIVIGVAGPGACFMVLALAYLAPIAVLLLVIPDLRPVPRETRATAISDIVAGFRLVRTDPLLRGIFVVSAVLVLLGASFMPYMPVLVTTMLHGDAHVLGLLYSAGGIGGLLGGALLATIGRTGRRNRMLVAGGIAYAVSLYSLVHSRMLFVSLFAVVGVAFAFVAINTSMTTLLQTDVDPAVRGRMFGLYAMCTAGLFPLGTLLYGSLSHVVDLFTAVGYGGIAVGVVTVLVGTSRTFRVLTERRGAPV
jgi:MFS family permease